MFDSLDNLSMLGLNPYSWQNTCAVNIRFLASLRSNGGLASLLLLHDRADTLDMDIGMKDGSGLWEERTVAFCILHKLMLGGNFHKFKDWSRHVNGRQGKEATKHLALDYI